MCAMKSSILLAGLLVCMASAASDKPNLIYIMADDLGWHDVGFREDAKVITPNINWLKQNGIELTNYYSGPICSPSRSAMLTGKYPSNNGANQYILADQAKTCLPLEHKLWPEYLKDQGYSTRYIGKWHNGYCSDECLPTYRGFDEYKGIITGEAGFINWQEAGVLVRFENGAPSLKDIGTHLTHMDQDNAVEMITRHANTSADEPLFMLISPNAPHSPFDITPEMFEVHKFLDASDVDQSNRRKYLGLVNALDILVGKVLQALRDTNMFENSIVVFTSDNGGAAQPLPFPGLLAYGNNYPLRNAKGSLYEGGTRVPAIYFNPKLPKETRNTKRNFLMHVTDWVPTFNELAGGDSKIWGIDGISQVRNLGASYNPKHKFKVRHEFLYHLSDLVFAGSVCSDDDAAFRWRDWKLIYGKRATNSEPVGSEWTIPIESPELPVIKGDSCMRDDGHGNQVVRCLFNIRKDPSETTNLFDKHPRIVRHLLRKINRAKRVSKKNVYKTSLGETPETVQDVFGLMVPKPNYCDPETDFPLLPRPAICRRRNRTPRNFADAEDDVDMDLESELIDLLDEE